MKKLLVITAAILFVGFLIANSATVATAGPHHGGGGGKHFGHHGHGHHGHHGHWGHHGRHWWGSPIIYTGTVLEDNCYWEKRCYTNRFGERRCTRVQVCN